MEHKSSGKNLKIKLKSLSESSLVDDPKDPDFAAGYLEEVLQGGSLPAFLLAIRNVAMANGGMQSLARKGKLGRESMYKALSEDGNPQFSTLQTILIGVGLRFSVAASKRSRRSA